MSIRLTIDANDPIQQKSKDKFSFPFNGGILRSNVSEEGNCNVEKWVEIMQEYTYFLHDIFFACPEIPSFFSDRAKNDYSDRCIELLEIIKNDNIPIRTVIAINGNYCTYNDQQKDELVDTAIKYIDKYNIYGCVVTDFYIALKLHQKRPELVLNTSCNVNHYYLPSLKLWHEQAGIEIVNPNRPMARNLSELKKLYNAGFKIKLLINEHCTCICPNYLCSASCHSHTFCSADHFGVTPLQSCIIIPRWLDILDEYCTIYKLAGRLIPLDYVLNQMELYIMRTDDCFYNEFHTGGKIPIPCNAIPDQLLYCNTDCANCDKCTHIMNSLAWQFQMMPPSMFMWQ